MLGCRFTHVGAWLNGSVQRRCTSSSVRLRQLLKKFMFQVHPDYFQNEKSLQQVNATNLSTLQGLIDQPSSLSDVGVRSLTFYIKPELVGSKPQKVRVSTVRIEKSIAEILETIGVETSDGAEDGDEMLQSSQSTVMASAEETLEFLNSMFERKALMALRQVRAVKLKRLEKEVLELTGAAQVVYQNSWSAQNNALLLSMLGQLVRQHRERIELPWTGMSIVYTKTEDETRINYLNREILLDPSDVPEQVLAVLQTIRTSSIAESQAHVDQIALLKAVFERTASALVLAELHRTASATKNATHPSSSDAVITLHKGFTCSMTNLYYFLYAMNDKQLITDRAVLSETTDASDAANQTAPNEHGAAAYLIEPTMRQDLLRPPLTVRITVEDRHGTKVLEDGSFRVDVMADKRDVYALLRSSAKDVAEQIARHRVLQDEIASLRAALIAELELLSIVPAVGVSEEQLVEFLRRLKAHSGRSSTHTALRQLHGLHVVVGHYLGVTDEGACVLPWELSLPAP